MRKLLNILYSTRLTAFAFIIFSITMAVATFIENDYGTQTAKKLVYNTWWFELIHVIFVINFFGNIFKYKLYRKEKWTVLTFHLAFLLIIIGSAVTRYISYEGMMVLDEKETSNTFLSETNFINFIVDDKSYQKEYNEELLLSAWGTNNEEFSTTFHPNIDAEKHEINFKLIDYIPWAERKFIEDENGTKHLLIVESSSGSRHEHYIKQGTVENLHNILIGFDAKQNSANINLKSNKDGGLDILTKTSGNYMIMASQKKGIVIKDSLQKFNLRSLYNISGLPFVIPKPALNGEIKTLRGKKSNEKSDIVVFDITVNGKTERKEFSGGQYSTSGKEQFKINDLNFRAWYGSKQLELPFQIKLNDFQLENYPGSESAASFASEVTVIDKDNKFDFRIFMNNILDYKGYRFFQASYRNAGEEIEQTHLSVNHDYWGTLITYIGYFILYGALIMSLFVGGTRFAKLKKSLEKIRSKKTRLSVILILVAGINGYSQQGSVTRHMITNKQVDSILKSNIINKKHAYKFSKLVIQDAGGRMKPAHTFASELVRKVAHTDKFKGYTPSQILLSITENPRFWYEVPFVYLGLKHNKKIRKMLGVHDTVMNARLSDFFNEKGEYKIKDAVNKAQKSKIKNKFDQDLLNADKRTGLLYSALGGSILKIYPIPNDPNNKWVSHMESKTAGFKGQDSLMIPRLLPTYLQTLQSAKKSKDYSKADNVLSGMRTLQRKYGKKVIPSVQKIDLEIKYNKWKIFMTSSYLYLTFGLLMIILVVLEIFYSNTRWLTYVIKALIGLVGLTFLYHAFGLGLRWYLSGNAPWSNAYESIVFVAWSTMLFGLWFGRKSFLTIGTTAFLASIILTFAHLNWIDPEIANLVPVLNSWWLMVHVSIISASYGPFALCMILSVVVLLLYIFSTEKNKNKMDLNIKELTIINEMSMNVGLVMLTIGTFLGGMWANESWGRYWSWDPKETWALISIMIYAFVLHMRLIPKLKGTITFNFASAFAFLSIMMTYFGVNFYLSGLHSYASGDKAVTPREAYYYIAVIVTLTIVAKLRHNKNVKNQK